MSRTPLAVATGKPRGLLFLAVRRFLWRWPSASSGTTRRDTLGFPIQFPTRASGGKNKGRRNLLLRQPLRCRGERIRTSDLLNPHLRGVAGLKNRKAQAASRLTNRTYLIFYGEKLGQCVSPNRTFSYEVSCRFLQRILGLIARMYLARARSIRLLSDTASATLKRHTEDADGEAKETESTPARPRSRLRHSR